MRVAVIGAGPAGLVTLKYLLAASDALGTDPVEVRLFEADSGVGGTFRARTYEDGELVSSRQLTTFSDFRRPDGPDFFTTAQYLRYLNDYCSFFKLWPHMNFGCWIQHLEKRKDGSHTLTYIFEGQQYQWDCDAVAICSGLHVMPSMPQIDGIDRVPLVIHSSQFKSREQFGVGKTVLVLGSGETASDIALLAVTAPTKRVVLCHRDGFHLAPTRNPNPLLLFSRARSPSKRDQVPIDASRASLFDTAYVHPWLRNSSILWTYYDYYVRWISWVSWGTTHGSDQWIGAKPPGWSTSEIFFNKSGHKIAPYMNALWKPKQPGTVPQHLHALLVRSQTPDTKGRALDVAPFPSHIDEHGAVHFRETGRPESAYMRARRPAIKPDVVVYCTGYRHSFPFLGPSCPSSSSAATDLVRDIWPRGDRTLGFVGFVRPNLGAIPPLAEMQAQLWVWQLLLGPESSSSPSSSSSPPPEFRPGDEAHYRLRARRGARVRHGVDHESYAYQLALDLGAAPGFPEVLRMGWRGTAKKEGAWYKLPLTWALGANFNAKFRLRGPWAWEGAAEVMVDELWDTVARREVFFGHITLSLVPMLIFGPLSLLTYLVASLVYVISFGRYSC
ncbi:hypothetical protein F4780DRAFT_783602 [Xylariomycetidae sp. FL0641]|nr:hypothetical protein F4780DRAFT_783602 [Xylariomycetidae sp. FL0641]